MQKFVRFEKDGQAFYGLLKEHDICVLEGDIFTEYTETELTYKLQDVKLLTPCEPSKAVCVGLNYRSHAIEMGMTLPEEPILFLKPSTSVIAANENIIYWPGISRLDYEAELAVVIGKKAHNVPEKEALDYVLGYTAGNDVTARDLQKKDGQWTRAKGFNSFLPLGPAIVTDVDPSNLSVQAFLNGELKQNSNTADLIFPVPYLVSYISRIMTLLPGDVILTGTPEGVGPMQPGDRIEIRIEHIGSLINKVKRP
ncbi:MAG: fumarylacetoacetate hydrolase family protein [Peptococcaceae bacterium]|jgi:2-keto-4-pentenoate hydratase/2-oxohepta-3-ene-1,7-dioic acid hydratase in catechol pathway|nr:fumarylacetoacetate hydrolase family protein [Peptococcaceae bacterium]